MTNKEIALALIEKYKKEGCTGCVERLETALKNGQITLTLSDDDMDLERNIDKLGGHLTYNHYNYFVKFRV